MQITPAKYTKAEKHAVSEAYLDRGIRPARRIHELAKAGELTYNGEKLPAFEMPVNSITAYARDLHRRRAGKGRSALADAPPLDAVEALRRRLVAALDHELGLIEDLQRLPRARRPELGERIRATARAVREVQGLTAPKPAKTRYEKPNQAHGTTGEVGGIAGAMLREHRRGSGAPLANEPHAVADAVEQPAAPAPQPDQDADIGSAAWIEAERARRLREGSTDPQDSGYDRSEGAQHGSTTHVQRDPSEEKQRDAARPVSAEAV
jgi:hypothetical protein